MFLLWIGSVALATGMEVRGNERLTAGRAPARPSPPTRAAATWRARRSASARPAAACSRPRTTGTSTGAVNCAHDSMTPLGGMAPLVNMMLGEVSPGGVGAGLYGMLIFALLAVFIAGLMVGPHARSTSARRSRPPR